MHRIVNESFNSRNVLKLHYVHAFINDAAKCGVIATEFCHIFCASYFLCNAHTLIHVAA